MNFLRIENFDLAEKTVLIRAGIDSPQGSQAHEIIDNDRLNETATTLADLSQKNAKVVCIGHQGRPGKSDFTTTKQHAKFLSEKVKKEVQYVDAVFGDVVTQKVKRMQPGDILLLENARFSSEEMIDQPASAHAKSFLVKGLMPLFDYYINDAFTNSHRSHATMMGFTDIPNIAGENLFREVEGIEKASAHAERPFVLVLGGMKVDDYFGLIERLLKENKVDKILVGGLMADLGLIARGFHLGAEEEKLSKKDTLTNAAPIELLEKAKRFFEGYSDKFEIPVDVALDDHGQRKEVSTKDLPVDVPIQDIGKETMERYTSILASAKTIFLKGPMGLYEQEPFAEGSKQIIQAIAASNAYTLVGGGNTAAVIDRYSSKDKFSHISLAGGATITMLEEGTLPALQSLEQNYEQFKHLVKN